MTLYTRTGDKGFTLLPGADGKTFLRIRKDDPRLEALGALDELNAAVGVCAVEAGRAENKEIGDALARIQEDLFRVGSVLAAIGADTRPEVRLSPSAMTRMEKQIDGIWSELGKLEHFVRPGGCELAARLHLARSVARRAERATVTALQAIPTAKRSSAAGVGLGRYLNRLSDLLFALARKANRDSGVDESTWQPSKPAAAPQKKKPTSAAGDGASCA